MNESRERCRAKYLNGAPFRGFPYPYAKERAAVVAEALTWLRTPWCHRGRVKGGGVDCGGFVLGVLERVGALPHVEVPNYSPQFFLHRSEEWLLDIVKAHAVEMTRPPLPGDLVLYRIGRCISHIALVTQWPQVIHAKRGPGVTLDDGLANPELSQRQVGVWSLRQWA